jgi:hypothetical protein
MANLWRFREHFLWTAGVFLKRGWPKTVLHFGFAPGDDLLCTVVLREMKQRGLHKNWMMSNHPDLFLGNKGGGSRARRQPL